MATGTILDRITDRKRDEIARRRQAVSLDTIQAEATRAPAPRDFAAALHSGGAGNAAAVRLIAEVKRASPSKGPIRPDLDPVALAREYEASGAAAISVLTDEHFFQGSLDDLRAVREAVSLPVLRKDFVLSPYQVYEARAAGADAILLIVAILDDGDLAALYYLAGELGMGVLVEVHDEAELARALRIRPRIVGVNNRDLRTFDVDLETTARLRAGLPADITLVAESGIRNRADVERLAAIGADAMLVGESLVRAGSARAKIQELIG